MAGQQVLHGPGREVHLEQAVGEPVGEVLVEEAELAQLGDVGRHLRVLAPLRLLLHGRPVALFQLAGQCRNHLRGKDDALVARQPFRCADAIGQFEDFFGLAAVDGDDVERRGFVVAAFGNENDALAVLAPVRRAITARLRGEPAGCASAHIGEPQAGRRLVLFDAPFLHAVDRALAIGRQHRWAQSLDGPEVLRGDRSTVVGCMHGQHCAGQQQAEDRVWLRRKGSAWRVQIGSGATTLTLCCAKRNHRGQNFKGGPYVPSALVTTTRQSMRYRMHACETLTRRFASTSPAGAGEVRTTRHFASTSPADAGEVGRGQVRQAGRVGLRLLLPRVSPAGCAAVLGGGRSTTLRRLG